MGALRDFGVGWTFGRLKRFVGALGDFGCLGACALGALRTH